MLPRPKYKNLKSKKENYFAVSHFFVNNFKTIHRRCTKVTIFKFYSSIRIDLCIKIVLNSTFAYSNLHICLLLTFKNIFWCHCIGLDE